MACNRLEIIRNIFFKTKLCLDFQLGTCLYGANCNYAHSMEEMRKLPSNWRELVDVPNPRDESSILLVGESDEREESLEWERFVKSNFAMDEEPEIRGSDAICLVNGSTNWHKNPKKSKLRFEALHWKTKLCSSWELSRFCSFGSECSFAHGASELRPYLGRPVNVDKEVEDASAHDEKNKPEPAKTSATIFRPPSTSRKLPSSMQNPGERRVRWKGPDKISKVYGDWIDDL